jgi:hypothetical protein
MNYWGFFRAKNLCCKFSEYIFRVQHEFLGNIRKPKFSSIRWYITFQEIPKNWFLKLKIWTPKKSQQFLSTLYMILQSTPDNTYPIRANWGVRIIGGYVLLGSELLDFLVTLGQINFLNSYVLLGSTCYWVYVLSGVDCISIKKTKKHYFQATKISQIYKR